MDEAVDEAVVAVVEVCVGDYHDEGEEENHDHEDGEEGKHVEEDGEDHLNQKAELLLIPRELHHLYRTHQQTNNSNNAAPEIM